MNDQSDNLHALRHSAEHVLTQAMIKLYGNDKIIMAMGPATDDGFYFDFDSPKDFSISADNFKAIEKEMHHIINQNLPITRKEISVEEARKLFEGNPYKQEWLDEIEAKNEPVSVYYTGEDFVDLCAGPHASSTGEIKAFKLLSVAGAYWHGDEKNKMLTRIYGTSFDSQEALADHLHRLEEAKKRDHRKIGADLNLFVFSDLIGKGLPMLTPKGASIRRVLERFIVDEELKRGYQHVITPPLAKVDLYRTSGHYPYYKDTMYPPMVIDEEELILRPMTCPHHFMLYKSSPKSYRDLPVRFAEISPQFRYEKSGELTGLIRVRMFMLADAHIICQKDQAETEIRQVLELIDFVNASMGLKKGTDYRYRLSLGDRSDDNKKYYKDDAAWEEAEEVLRNVLKSQDAPYYEAPGEAAFYGPKIDVQMKNVAGKEESAFTVQYDFVMPKRFNMRYVNPDNQEAEPVVVHRSSLGCFERTMAFLIEHYAGALPLWIAPVQAVILPIGEEHVEYAYNLKKALEAKDIRVEVLADDSIGKRIRNSEKQKIPYMLVVGQKEVEGNTVSVRVRGEKDLGVMPTSELVEKIQAQITSKQIDL